MSGAIAEGSPRLGLLGSPNSGKTTLFNALTGLRAKVGNYPGVTVERREGEAVLENRRIVIVDLPGTYSLKAISPDEEVVNRILDGEIATRPDALVVVADACSLERSLLFIAQVLRRDTPTCLVLTMTDELRARGGALRLSQLERALGIPVRGVVGHKGLGLGELRRLLARPENWSRPHLPPPEDVEERAAWAESILSNVLTHRPGAHRVTDAIDRVVLHPMAGAVLFAVVMVLFFQLIFAWATPAMDWIDAAVGHAAEAVRATLPAGLLTDFLADALIAGVGAVIIFVPQIALLFGLLYLLEDVGYMARAAFVIDRVMGRIGLEGRSFVSLLSSYACAVPGIMAARTIPSPRNRLITMLVAPLMTCSARLPVFALLIAAFVPATQVGPLGLQGLTLLGLYLLGASSALLVAAVLKRPAHDAPARHPDLGQSVDLPAASRDHHPGGLGRDVGAPHIPQGGAAVRAEPSAGGALRPRAQPGRPGRPRHRAADRTAGLRLEDRRGAVLEPGSPRGDHRDPGSDVRRQRRGDLAARGRPPGRRPADRAARLHAGRGRLPAGLLRLRAAVHVDARRPAPRNQLVALARLRLHVSARDRVRGELRHLSHRIRAGRRDLRPIW
jgi:GTP-binding protein EngB required for normal cell division